jgi:acetylglutamate kinase
MNNIVIVIHQNHHKYHNNLNKMHQLQYKHNYRDRYKETMDKVKMIMNNNNNNNITNNNNNNKIIIQNNKYQA